MMQHRGSHQISNEMQQCIQRCLDCHSRCLETVAHCLEQGGRHAEANRIRLRLDCAEICQTSANFMLRGSDLHRNTCEICVKICERCARDCEQFGDAARMRTCAAVRNRAVRWLRWPAYRPLQSDRLALEADCRHAW
jgi:hypothetical protein